MVKKVWTIKCTLSNLSMVADDIELVGSPVYRELCRHFGAQAVRLWSASVNAIYQMSPFQKRYPLMNTRPLPVAILPRGCSKDEKR
ncbi:Ornithine transaminase [Echinococcus multilocularis]|uniref:Ornithine transaminase n=1 Tax=Echinococcus multilocularis TaxID=6211 RepID=A0A0S4MN85_ECHMU|nr:Ornithine transaminase [Echinococcus multilocularis]